MRYCRNVIIGILSLLFMWSSAYGQGSSVTTTIPAQTCPISVSTMEADVEREILRLLQTYDFATLEFMVAGDQSKTIQLRDAFGTQQTLLVSYDRAGLGQGGVNDFDCILVHPDVWYQQVAPGTAWSATGILPKILQQFNGMTLAGIREFIAAKTTGGRLWDYSIGNANFTVETFSPFLSVRINTVYNPFNQKRDLSPMEMLVYYAFNASPQVKKMKFETGQVPSFIRDRNLSFPQNTSTSAPKVWCGSNGITCAPDFYYTLRQADMDRLYQDWSARRVDSGNTPLGVGSSFQFLLRSYGEQRAVVAYIQAMDPENRVTRLDVELYDEADTLANPQPVEWLLKILGPTCNNWQDLWAGVCGTDIIYCQSGECGFTTGLEKVREGLQESNVSTTNSLKELVRGWLNFALGFLFLLTVVVIITAGIMMVGNFGNEDLISKAKSMILYGIVGLLLIILAYPIVNTLINVVQ